jgi:hypothetical protein
MIVGAMAAAVTAPNALLIGVAIGVLALVVVLASTREICTYKV